MTRAGIALIVVGVALALLGVLTWDAEFPALDGGAVFTRSNGPPVWVGEGSFLPVSRWEALWPDAGGFWVGAGWASALIGVGLVVAGRRQA
ncbi:MAG: hypothetical protein AB7G37_05835 [Solirubrobacteraceae bacterium]